MKFLILLTLIVSSSVTTAILSDYFSTKDQSKLLHQLEQNLLTADDLPTIFNSLVAYSTLKKEIPPLFSKRICPTLTDANMDLEAVYQSEKTMDLLKCPGQTKKDVQKIKQVLDKDKVTTEEIFYVTSTLLLWKQSVPSTITQKLNQQLKEDDSLLSYAYAFHAAALLPKEQAISLFDRVEDVIGQADEVDGKMMQFEGGITVTGFLLSAILRLSSIVAKDVPWTGTHAEKFANYLLTRKHVQTPKGMRNFIEAVTLLADTQHSPIAVLPQNNGIITNNFLQIRVCDVIGRTLPNVVVSAQSATRIADDVVVLSKQRMLVKGELYELEFKFDAGRYRVVVAVNGQTVLVKAVVLGRVNVPHVEIAVHDTDDQSAVKFIKVTTSQQPLQLSADAQQKLSVRVPLYAAVQQVFIRMENEKSRREVVFVATMDAKNGYKFELDIGVKTSELGLEPGKHQLELIIGDATITNSFRWHFADLSLTIPSPHRLRNIRQPKPTIEHLFRQPEPRPPAFISMLFTSLAIAPLLLLMIMWIRLGVNVNNFSKTGIWAILFHTGLAAIFGLFVAFWLQLDMFKTSKYLLLLGIVTFLAGHRLLNIIANTKQH